MKIMTDLEDIKKRIRALLEKTKNHGCSEEEATAAAQKAAELMEKYGLDQNDVEMTKVAQDVEVGIRSMRARLWPALARYTNTYLVLQVDNKLEFYGHEPWPEIAAYLVDVCDRAIVFETNKFKKSAAYKKRRTTNTRKQAVADFTYALVKRLSNKLAKLFEKTVSDQAFFDAEKYALKANTSLEKTELKRHHTKYSDASDAGWKAGGNVNISHGVRQAETAKITGW